MNETYVTLRGWVGAEVEHRTPGGVSVATMRVAVTPRVRRGGTWQDGETAWYAVTAWRALADHVRASVAKGDAVIVHGRLRPQTWSHGDERPATTLAVEASLVGHDLTRGTSTFLRASRAERGEPDPEGEASTSRLEPAHAPQPDSWGDPRPGEPAA